MINKSYCGYHKYRGDVSESEKSCLQQTAEETSTLAPPQPPRRPPLSLNYGCLLQSQSKVYSTSPRKELTMSYLSRQLYYVRSTDTIIRPIVI